MRFNNNEKQASDCSSVFTSYGHADHYILNDGWTKLRGRALTIKKLIIANIDMTVANKFPNSPGQKYGV
jgi:hypothetical protein